LVDDFAVESMYEVFAAAPKDGPKRYRIDCYTTHMTGNGEPIELLKLFPWSAKKMIELQKDQEELFNRFRGLGVKLEFTNPPKGLGKYVPVFGRNHLKNSGVGERVFYVRGFNDDGLTAGSVDFAVKFTGEAAARLKAGFESIDTDEGNSDYEVEIDQQTRLIVDRGVPGQSMIYDILLENMQQSLSSIKGMSALVPDGRGAKALAAAQTRGSSVEVFVSPAIQSNPAHPFSFGNMLWMAEKANYFNMQRNGVSFPVFRNQIRGAHGKCWIFDGKTAIFGTHNASEKGVKAGTCEAAIITTNQKIIQGLQNVFSQTKLESYPDIKGVI